MKKLLSSLCAFSLVCGGLTVPAMAAFVGVGTSARGAGMGDAQTAVADDAYSVFYNPAGLATLYAPQLASTYSRLLLGLSDGSSLQNSDIAYAHPLGRAGAVGAAWNYFSLNNLYQEHTGALAYGARLFPRLFPLGLYGGASLKLLNRSLDAGSAYSQPLDVNGMIVPGRVDPVLQSPTKTAFDADLGLLGRLSEHYTVGLTLKDALNPNMAFSDSDSDPIGRTLSAGLAWRTTWTTLVAQLDRPPAPDGTVDTDFTVGGEKWLPTLLHGEFGLRASLGLGTRDFKQVTAGVSYRVNRLQFDYGWVMPLGTISATAGSHRFGLSLLFGEPAESGRLNEAILENMEQLAQQPGVDYRYRIGEVAVYENRAVQELMQSAYASLEVGRFHDARTKAADASSLRPDDPDLRAKRQRLERLAAAFPRLDFADRDPFESAILSAGIAYFYGRDEEALQKFRYATQLRPDDDRPLPFLRELSHEPVKAAPPADLTAKSEQARRALEGGRSDDAVALCREILQSDPNNVLAWLRIGIARYRQRRFSEAADALEAALANETSPEVRKAIQGNLDAVRRESAQPRREASPPPAPPATRAGRIEKWYEEGIEAYAKGDLDGAIALFKKILAEDPGNDAASKALRRIEAEKAGGAP